MNGRPQTYADYYGYSTAYYPAFSSWAPWIDTTYYGPMYEWTDEDIADNVINNIDSNPYISRSSKDNIEVGVKDGVVTLSGEVKNRHDQFLAYADAFWSSGVVEVVNELKIREEPKKREEEKKADKEKMKK